MPELKPAYLIHGDDHGAVAERRAGLRALAEAGDSDASSVELLEGDAATPAGVADALAAMTLAIGRRVIVVDGVERWRESDVEKLLVPAIAAIAPETTLALFAREEGRAKAPAALHEAVKRAGGQVVAQDNVKPWELPKWAREQAARLGLTLDAAAAKALVAQVGERQQRLLRELEKLALEGDGEARAIDVEEIEARAAHSAQWRSFALADALVGADARESTLAYLRLREQGERLSGLIYLMAQRLRDARRRRAAAGRTASRSRRSSAACECRRARPSVSSPTSSAATWRGCAARSACWPTSSSTRAAAPSSRPTASRWPRSARTRSRCARSNEIAGAGQHI